MADNLADIDVLEKELDEVTRRLVGVLPIIDAVEAAQHRFDKIQAAYEEWSSYVAAWPALNDEVRRSIAASNAAAEGIDARVALVRDELFAVVDNAKADFAARVSVHRGEIERLVGVLRDELTAHADATRQDVAAARRECADAVSACNGTIDRLASALATEAAARAREGETMQQQVTELQASLRGAKVRLWMGVIAAALVGIVSRVEF